MSSVYKIEYAAAAEDDLTRIQRHLMQAWIAFGETLDRAYELADARERNIRTQVQRVGRTPGIGRTHDDLLPGLRQVTLDRTIIWFIPDHADHTLRVIALFHGTEDHMRAMTARLQG